jgi:hypothetical protein
MRRPSFITLALVPAIGLTLFGVPAAFIEGSGPYDDHTTFSSSRLIDRQALGYTNASQYGYWQWQRGSFSYCGWDDPYVPDEPPGAIGDWDPARPLPALVKRTEIYGIGPELILGALAVMWTILIAFSAAKRSRARQRGFDVQPRS